MESNETSKTADEPRVTCRYPGCEEPPESADGPGRPPAYCANPAHNATTAFRRRRELAAQAEGRPAPVEDLDRPVTMGQARAAELLRATEQLAVRTLGELERVVSELRTIADPDAAAAEVAGVQATAAEQVAAAEARAVQAERVASLAAAGAETARAEREQADAVAEEALRSADEAEERA
ncbi:hypothetical protein ACQEVJ_46400, partial [Microbispora sp. CA-102843]